MNQIPLPVVHPGFQHLRRNGKLLHAMAALLILFHALQHFREPNNSLLYSGCLVLIAIDILILVFTLRNLVYEWPRINLFFRLLECLFFLGIGTQALIDHLYYTGIIHFLFMGAYLWLFYCEIQSRHAEQLILFHTGIEIPALPENHFISWSAIARLTPTYHSIEIVTNSQQHYRFELTRNLQFEELDQIHEFRRHYLGVSAIE